MEYFLLMLPSRIETRNITLRCPIVQHSHRPLLCVRVRRTTVVGRLYSGCVGRETNVSSNLPLPLKRLFHTQCTYLLARGDVLVFLFC